MSMAEEQQLLESQDPARIAPRAFLMIPLARDAIKLETGALTAEDKSGIPSLLSVALGDERYKKCAKVFCAVVVKKSPIF